MVIPVGGIPVSGPVARGNCRLLYAPLTRPHQQDQTFPRSHLLSLSLLTPLTLTRHDTMADYTTTKPLLIVVMVSAVISSRAHDEADSRGLRPGECCAHDRRYGWQSLRCSQLQCHL